MLKPTIELQCAYKNNVCIKIQNKIFENIIIRVNLYKVYSLNIKNFSFYAIKIKKLLFFRKPFPEFFPFGRNIRSLICLLADHFEVYTIVIILTNMFFIHVKTYQKISSF